MGISLAAEIAKYGVLSTSDHTSVASICLFATLLCACIVIGHLLEENRWVNESITALLIGLLTGFIILLTTQWKSSHILVFSEDLFFIYLLPPIIFNAGFQVKKKQFFRNFMTIMLFGAVGTLISFSIISLGAITLLGKINIGLTDIGDYLALGAIFSATDSVCTLQVLNQDETPLLYSLVFGEGVVNDATSVVLFNAIQHFDLVNIDFTIILHFAANFLYLFFTSTVLGVWSLCNQKLIFRKVAAKTFIFFLLIGDFGVFNFISSKSVLTFYSSSMFFCGIVMSHYTWHNVTESSRITTKHTFAALSFIAEIFIFLYVGMDALDIEKWRFIRDSPGKSVAISSIILGTVMVGRAAFVFPLSFLSNLSKKYDHEKISFNQQITIWWAGLMRGAVSMALAYNQFTTSGHTDIHENAVMITSTITVVLFSTVVFGLLTKPLISYLVPPQQGLKHMSSLCSDSVSPKSFLAALLGNNGHEGEETHGVPQPTSLRMLVTSPTRTVHYYWRKFDDAIMRPMFGGRGFVPFVPGSPTEEPSVHPF
uniref:Na+/H+ antiporter n=1 Tax=Zostera marina TaxID=29655 RepID=B2DCZ5_ZOSMR|nr:Na+/H+ antiporter [Zostera marina]